LATYTTRALGIAASYPGNVLDYERVFKMRGQCRRFVLTETGRMALTLPAGRSGDVICVLFGGRTPFLLRPMLEPHCYTFLGECFVRGIMDGEVINRWENGEFERELLRLF
jgi:hypothetical protein